LTSESTRAILQNELEQLFSRMDALYEMACKGVHADVSAEKAQLAIIDGLYFYMGNCSIAEIILAK